MLWCRLAFSDSSLTGLSCERHEDDSESLLTSVKDLNRAEEHFSDLLGEIARISLFPLFTFVTSFVGFVLNSRGRQVESVSQLEWKQKYSTLACTIIVYYRIDLVLYK